MYYRNDSLALNIVISRVELVRFFVKILGLKIGNKVRQQIDIPRWIMKNKNFTHRGNEVRLSKNVVPIKYDIQLKPDLDNFTFEGIETITLSVLKQTKVLTLHSKEIEIETASILRQKKKFFAKISYNEKKETATFVFPKNLEVLPPLGGRTSKFSCSKTPVKRILARLIILDTSAVCLSLPLGCRRISTISPCIAVFKFLKSTSISCLSCLFFSPPVATYPVPFEVIDITPCNLLLWLFF